MRDEDQRLINIFLFLGKCSNKPLIEAVAIPLFCAGGSEGDVELRSRPSGGSHPRRTIVIRIRTA